MGKGAEGSEATSKGAVAVACQQAVARQENKPSVATSNFSEVGTRIFIDVS